MSLKPKALLVMNSGTFADQFDSTRLQRLARTGRPWRYSRGPIHWISPDSPGAWRRWRSSSPAGGFPAHCGAAGADAQAAGRLPLRRNRAQLRQRRTMGARNPGDQRRGRQRHPGRGVHLRLDRPGREEGPRPGQRRPRPSATTGATQRGAASWATSAGSIGVIGFSRIGRRVVQLVQQLQDVTCLVSDPHADPWGRSGRRHGSFRSRNSCRVSDIVTVHAPALPETRHMIGAAELRAMKDHATLINTARGSLVDTTALEVECATGRHHALLDVTEPEPLPADSRAVRPPQRDHHPAHRRFPGNGNPAGCPMPPWTTWNGTCRPGTPRPGGPRGPLPQRLTHTTRRSCGRLNPHLRRTQ